MGAFSYYNANAKTNPANTPEWSYSWQGYLGSHSLVGRSGVFAGNRASSGTTWSSARGAISPALAPAGEAAPSSRNVQKLFTLRGRGLTA